MKKYLAIALAIVMILALSVPAFAAKNDSITINNAKEGETYSIYKLFDLVVDNEETPAKYSYTVASEWASFFAAGGAGAGYVTIENGYVTAISDAAALAKAAAGALEGKTKAAADVVVAENATTAVFSGLDDGYYLITSTLGTIAMTETTPDASAVTINEKNPEDTIEKEVKEDSTGTYGDENDAQIGDLVEFKSTVKIVKGTRNVVVHDKMTDGLSYTAGSVQIAGLTKNTEYTVNESPSDGDTFDIIFDQSWIDALDFGTDGYKEYEITYTATLNENAVVSGDVADQTNETHVSYGDSTDSESDYTTTETHKFSVYKHAAGSTDNLADAVFSLKKAGTVVPLIKIDDTHYRVAKTGETGTTDTFVTVASGDIVILGVDADNDYSLEEITPPSGYNQLPNDVNVTVDAGNGTRVDVENKSGTELPSTGGIGTTIFYVLGSLLVLGAGVLLITRTRMRKEQ